jgi:hypothetical protein
MCEYERIKIPFGEYVQAHIEPKKLNSNEPRTLDGIYLRPLDAAQIQHEVMHLATGRVVTCNRVTVMKMTDNVVAQVHAMADRAGIKRYTYGNRRREDEDPDAWSAGVDYDDYAHTEDDILNIEEDETDDSDSNDDDYDDELSPE